MSERRERTAEVQAPEVRVAVRAQAAWRAHARAARSTQPPLYLRVLFVVAGFTLLAGGLAMLVLPGPALAVIPIALAILSLEFAWAGRLLEKALERPRRRRRRRRRPRGPSASSSPSRSPGGDAAIVGSILWEIPVVPYT